MTSAHLPASSSFFSRQLCWTLAALACVIAWDGSGLDMPVAHWFGNSQGFPLQSNWFMVHIAHDGARMLAWLVVLGLSLNIWWPVGPMRSLPYSRRVQLVVSIFIALVVMGLIKRVSTTSCPWDLVDFGGLGHYVSHWAWGTQDGGGGHCFPAGHASAGFGFLGGYFALRHHQPRAARIWLTVSLIAGFALGWAQQMRGAHFMSHTLWTAWLCWTAGWLCDLVATRVIARRQQMQAGWLSTQ